MVLAVKSYFTLALLFLWWSDQIQTPTPGSRLIICRNHKSKHVFNVVGVGISIIIPLFLMRLSTFLVFNIHVFVKKKQCSQLTSKNLKQKTENIIGKWRKDCFLLMLPLLYTHYSNMCRKKNTKKIKKLNHTLAIQDIVTEEKSG